MSKDNFLQCVCVGGRGGGGGTAAEGAWRKHYSLLVSPGVLSLLSRWQTTTAVTFCILDALCTSQGYIFLFLERSNTSVVCLLFLLSLFCLCLKYNKMKWKWESMIASGNLIHTVPSRLHNQSWTAWIQNRTPTADTWKPLPLGVEWFNPTIRHWIIHAVETMHTVLSSQHFVNSFIKYVKTCSFWVI